MAGPVSDVPLAAKLFLLSCHDETGRPRVPPGHLELGLGGALLRDLVRLGRVELVDGHVVVLDRTPLDDPLLDNALAVVAHETRPRDLEFWVRHLARRSRTAVEHRLVTSGLLRVDDHRVLGLFPVHHARHTDDSLEHELIGRLQEAVVLDRPPDPDTAALASLALGVGLEGCLFPRADQRAVRRRMEEIAEGEPIGAAVRHAVGAQDAALGIESGAGGAAP